MLSQIQRLSAVLLSLLTLFALPGLANVTQDPMATVKQANASFRKLLRKVEPGSEAEKELVERLNREMRKFFDIGDLTKRAMKRHWDEMTPDQQNELVNTLRTLIEKNYVKHLRSNFDYQVKYNGEQKKGEDVVVSTVIEAKRKGRPMSITVDYVMHQDQDAWRVWDVITDDVSIVRNYRSQFNRIIAKEGIEGLFKRMKRKLEQMDES